MIEVRDVRLALDGDLKTACAKKLRVPVGDVLEAALLRRSVDARRKDDVHFTVTAAVSLRRGEEKFSPYTPWTPPRVEVLKKKPALRPVVCGAGPAGLFAALTLARAGAEPILLERGSAVDERKADVEKFYQTRALDTESNIQFGEGGAGAFSDGKLNTGTHDKRGRQVLHDLVQAGAPDEILWQAKPHIGTDRLPDAVKGLREMILAHGGEVRFRTKLTDVGLSGGVLRSVRAAHGELVLRIEDLDTLRCSAENAEILKDDLRWLGLTWDAEQPDQSTRSEYYESILDRLRGEGFVYPCWCTRGDLKNAANAPHASDGHPIYPGTCRDLTEEERAAKAKVRAPLWRLRVPDESIAFSDGHYGPYAEKLARECGDFILRRADGVFAYQLAVVADDIDAGITQVVRGRDLLSSTPRQLYLYRLLNAAPPEYYHVPLLTAPDGRRLSKRDRDLDLGILRKAYTAPELLGALAHAAGLLDQREPISAKELIPLFDWAKIPKDDIAIDV